MIELIKRENGKSFDLPKDIKISIERNNAMFAETGSFSLPFKVPCTANNLQILNFPHEIAQKDYDAPAFEVLLNISSFQFVGKFKVLSVAENEIQATILFDNSDLYAKIGDTMLPDLFKDEIFDYAPQTTDRNVKIAALLDAMTYTMLAPLTDYYIQYPFCCFPVATENGDKLPIILNEQDSSKVEYGDGAYFGNYHPLTAKTAYVFNDGTNNIDIPIGYNATPLLRVNYVLHKIFELFGYELISDLNNFICILNNTCDSLMAGKIYASHLLPDIKVSEFLQTIRTMFGCEFVLQNDFKKIKIIYYKNIFNNKKNRNFTKLLRTKPIIQYQEKQTLNLTVDKPELADLTKKQYTSTSKPNLAVFNTVQDAVKQTAPLFYYSIKDYNYLRQFAPMLFFNQSIANFTHLTLDENGYIKTLNGVNRIMGYFDSDANLTGKELPTKRKFASYYIHSDFLFYSLLPKARNKTTFTEIEKKVNENKANLDLYFVNALGRGLRLGANLGFIPEILNDRFFRSSDYIYNELGEKTSGFGTNLVWEGPRGLFENYLKEYDTALQKGMHLITCKLNLNDNEIVNYDFYTPVVINGVRCIPSKIQYEITAERISVVNAEFLMI